jgi:hypothetical protein
MSITITDPALLAQLRQASTVIELRPRTAPFWARSTVRGTDGSRRE